MGFRHRFSCFRAFVATCVLACAAMVVTRASAQSGGTDLDAFMKQVLAQRDENWKKLQQYVLD